MVGKDPPDPGLPSRRGVRVISALEMFSHGPVLRVCEEIFLGSPWAPLARVAGGVSLGSLRERNDWGSRGESKEPYLRFSSV